MGWDINIYIGTCIGFISVFGIIIYHTTGTLSNLLDLLIQIWKGIQNIKK